MPLREYSRSIQYRLRHCRAGFCRGSSAGVSASEVSDVSSIMSIATRNLTVTVHRNHDPNPNINRNPNLNPITLTTTRTLTLNLKPYNPNLNLTYTYSRTVQSRFCRTGNQVSHSCIRNPFDTCRTESRLSRRWTRCISCVTRKVFPKECADNSYVPEFQCKQTRITTSTQRLELGLPL